MNGQRYSTAGRRYAGHRFLTRSARRSTPVHSNDKYYNDAATEDDDDEDDDASTLPSMDNSFVRKLIDSRDTAFVEKLMGPTTTTQQQQRRKLQVDSEASSRLQNGGEKRCWWFSKKYGHVILGMVLMYLLLTLWERHRTQAWWSLYMEQLGDSVATSGTTVQNTRQYVEADGYGTSMLRGGGGSSAHVRDPLSDSNDPAPLSPPFGGGARASLEVDNPYRPKYTTPNDKNLVQSESTTRYAARQPATVTSIGGHVAANSAKFVTSNQEGEPLLLQAQRSAQMQQQQQIYDSPLPDTQPRIQLPPWNAVQQGTEVTSDADIPPWRRMNPDNSQRQQQERDSQQGSLVDPHARLLNGRHVITTATPP